MATTSLPYHHDPLSHPKAAFNGHSGDQPVASSSKVMSGSSKSAHDERSAMEEDSYPNESWQDEDVEDSREWRSSMEAIQLDTTSTPRINPFHLISHPASSSALPPLPPHLQRLAADTGDPPDTPNNNADYQYNGDPPIHITKVTSDVVKISSGPSLEAGKPKRIMKKVSSVFKRDTGANLNGDPLHISPVIMQGPPPSPPISEIDVPYTSEDRHTVDTHSTHDATAPTLPVLGGSSERSFSPNLGMFGTSLTSEPSDFSHPRIPKPVGSPTYLGVPARRPSTSSTASRAGSLSIVRSGRLAQPRAASAAERRSESGDKEEEGDTPNSPTGTVPMTLAPAIASGSQPRLTRRSTGPIPTPTSPKPTRSPLLHAQSTLLASLRVAIPGLEGVTLDPDILAETETIRRERLERRERRQKKASTASAVAPPEGAAQEVKARSETTEPKAKEEAKVLVGNLIGEDHVNYVLMYNMLTGIRIAVSRCQAKIKRPLTDEDFVAKHKFSFDIVGNELTPSAKYDFKFKDYAPWVFRDLRDDHFHLDPADYLLSLTAKYILSELGSPGKSGSFFYFSRDYRFIIKTISHSEHKFMRSILKQYHEHVKSNPHTLLSRFYGLHRVKLPRGRKIHFVIMNNLFPPHRDIHETYDLKGSAFGREYSEEKAKSNPKAVLKDKNWVNRGRTLELGPEKRALLSEQLRRDMEFLKCMRVMDYSLLVGIHNMERGNRDNLRENQLTIFNPEVPPVRRKPSSVKPSSDASKVRKAVGRSDPRSLDVVSQLPTSDSSDRRHFLFYQDEGGLRATDESNGGMDMIYYLGVIDFITPYNTAKKLEHFWKSMTEDRTTISCVDPVSYGQRFINFLLSVMRGGDLNLRPAGLSPIPPVTKEEERPVGSSNSPAAERADPTSEAIEERHHHQTAEAMAEAGSEAGHDRISIGRSGSREQETGSVNITGQ